MKTRYDVMVIGGGTAGVSAAIQAAREGADTLLVEKSERLGGTLTNACIAAPGLFHAWKKQIIAGIGWELICRSLAELDIPLPDFSTQDRFEHWRHQVSVNRDYFALLCDEAVQESGADVLLGTMCAKIEETDAEKRVTICTKEGLQEVCTKVLIDCTGDANAVSIAGYPVVRGETYQPGTYFIRLGGYDFDTLDQEAILAAFRAEVAKGHFEAMDICWNVNEPDLSLLRSHGGNTSHIYIPGCRTETSEGKTVFTMEARIKLLHLIRFFRTQPGLEHLTVEQLAPECGVRESVRIVGKKTVTGADYLAGTRYGDDVCYSFYPIDVHQHDGGGLKKIPLEEGIVPTIPRGAMLPQGSRNFLVAGRTVSADRDANSAMRVQATCMAEGQAAGALAVLAVRMGVDVEDVPMQALYTVLKKHGAIVPDDAE